MVRFRATKRKLLSFIDSGSEISLIKLKVAQELVKEENLIIKESDKRAISLTGHQVHFHGMIKLNLLFNGKTFHHNFYITSDANFNGATLIGLDFLHHFNVSMHFGNAKYITVKGQNFKYQSKDEYDEYESIRTIKEQAPEIQEYKVINTKKVVIPANSIYRINAVIVAPDNINENLIIEDATKSDLMKVERALVNKKRICIGCMNASDKPMILKHNQAIG